MQNLKNLEFIAPLVGTRLCCVPKGSFKGKPRPRPFRAGCTHRKGEAFRRTKHDFRRHEACGTLLICVLPALALELRRRLLFFLFLVINSRILVLLVLSDEVVKVRLGFSELHFVHALTGVPVEERLALEHGRELVG